MITTIHFIVGGAVGVATGNPYAGFVAGEASHFIIDSIPHLDVPPDAPRDDDENITFTPLLWTQVFIDGLVGLGVLVYLWSTVDHLAFSSPLLWGALGGFFPDLIDNVPFWNKRFRSTRFGKAFHRFHESTHEFWQNVFPMRRFWWLGIVTQVITVFVAWSFLVSR